MLDRNGFDGIVKGIDLHMMERNMNNEDIREAPKFDGHMIRGLQLVVSYFFNSIMQEL